MSSALPEDVLKAIDRLKEKGFPYSTIAASVAEDYADRVTLEQVSKAMGLEKPNDKIVKPPLITSLNSQSEAGTLGHDFKAKTVPVAQVSQVPPSTQPTPVVLVERTKIPFSFSPTATTQFVEGQFYFIRGKGVVKYVGLTNESSQTDYADNQKGIQYSTEVMKFVVQDGSSTATNLFLTQKKLDETFIRELTDKNTMGFLLQKLEFGLPENNIELSPKKLNSNLSDGTYWPRLMEVADLPVLCDILITVFSQEHNIKQKSISPPLFFMHADKALRIIANEYSVVMNLPFEKAIKIMKDKCGQTARTEGLNGFSKGLNPLATVPETPLLPPP